MTVRSSGKFTVVPKVYCNLRNNILAWAQPANFDVFELPVLFPVVVLGLRLLSCSVPSHVLSLVRIGTGRSSCSSVLVAQVWQILASFALYTTSKSRHREKGYHDNDGSQDDTAETESRCRYLTNLATRTDTSKAPYGQIQSCTNHLMVQ